MSSPDKIVAVRLHAVQVTDKTVWQFIDIETADGRHGVGEATVPDNADLREKTADLAQDILGLPANPQILSGPLPDNRSGAAVRSGIDHALWDLAAKRAGDPLASSLGAICRDTVPVYANINRRTVDRNPQGFVASAHAAIADGHQSFKLAPFDELAPNLAGDELRSALDAGFARIAAVRNAVGPDRRLMVDCHWRCSAASAETLIREAAALGLYWVECPVPETVENVGLLKNLRSLANGLGVRLAGCEENIGLDGFRPFISGGAYDVLMPDVKYAGGLSEFLSIADAAAGAGIDISPHNPSGPVSHLLSLDVCTVLPNLLMLEMQYNESALFETLVTGKIPSISDGQSALALPRPGLGADLNLGAAGDQIVTTQWPA